MSKTIGGVQFVRNGLQWDYCFIESIEALCTVCDKVIVVDAGSDDGTEEVLRVMESMHKNLRVIYMDKQDWDAHKGKEKLAHFQNVCTKQLDTDYQLLVQSDEIIHEDSYAAIRKAVETGQEGYMVSRINLWSSPFTKLVVPQDRQPCSTEVIRLAKIKYQSYSDGESLNAPADFTFVDDIRIYHMGFCRKRSVMRSKVINMQISVFGMLEYDKKLDLSEEFDSTLWFDGDDLAPIDEPLPKIIQEWSLKRM